MASDYSFLGPKQKLIRQKSEVFTSGLPLKLDGLKLIRVAGGIIRDSFGN